MSLPTLVAKLSAACNDHGAACNDVAVKLQTMRNAINQLNTETYALACAPVDAQKINQAREKMDKIERDIDALTAASRVAIAAKLEVVNAILRELDAAMDAAPDSDENRDIAAQLRGIAATVRRSAIIVQ